MSKSTSKNSTGKNSATPATPKKNSAINLVNARSIQLRERPLSPHLTIYKPQISSVMSITHRASGIFLVTAVLALVWFIISIACGREFFERTAQCFASPFGIALGFLSSMAAFYHLCTGIRHLFWDLGLGFSLPVMHKTGVLAIISALTLQVITWYILYDKLELSRFLNGY